MALPIWTKYMNKVYADKTLGYDETETFQLPPDYDPCADNGEVYEAVEEPTPDMGLDDLFN